MKYIIVPITLVLLLLIWAVAIFIEWTIATAWNFEFPEEFYSTALACTIGEYLLDIIGQ